MTAIMLQGSAGTAQGATATTPNQPVSKPDLAQQIEQTVQQSLYGTTQPASREGLRAAIDQMKAEIEAARAQGVQTITVQPTFGPDVIPQGAVDISMAFFAMVAFIIVGLPLARAFARRMDRRGQIPPTDPELSPRLQRIEQAVDAIAVEVERISENQRYASKVMSGLQSLPAGGPGAGWAGSPGRQAEPALRNPAETRRP